MKIKLLLSCFVILFTFTASYASFPVKRAKLAPVAVNENVTTTLETTDNTAMVAYAADYGAKSPDLLIGVLLWFFLGGLAAHRWYYGKPVGWNILFILTLGGLGVWWIIDLINMLSDNF